jgi:hypothetical protein
MEKEMCDTILACLVYLGQEAAFNDLDSVASAIKDSIKRINCDLPEHDLKEQKISSEDRISGTLKDNDVTSSVLKFLFLSMAAEKRAPADFSDFLSEIESAKKEDIN